MGTLMDFFSRVFKVVGGISAFLFTVLFLFLLNYALSGRIEALDVSQGAFPDAEAFKAQLKARQLDDDIAAGVVEQEKMVARMVELLNLADQNPGFASIYLQQVEDVRKKTDLTKEDLNTLALENLRELPPQSSECKAVRDVLKEPLGRISFIRKRGEFFRLIDRLVDMRQHAKRVFPNHYAFEEGAKAIGCSYESLGTTKEELDGLLCKGLLYEANRKDRPWRLSKENPEDIDYFQQIHAKCGYSYAELGVSNAETLKLLNAMRSL